MNFQIQELKKVDLKLLSELTPEGWNDVRIVYQTHFGQDYFFPIKLIKDDQIIGVGQLILNGKIGWLGNIIVRKKFRNQGIGKVLTQKLIELAWSKNCESIYLLATSLGKFVYQKLGFIENGLYLFFQSLGEHLSFEKNNNIISFQEKYETEILELDKLAMGEDRSRVISRFLEDGLVYKKPNEEKISGFFLPSLGDGLIISQSSEAGFEMIRKSKKLGKQRIILPEQCKITIQFLEKNGYKIYREPATFMYLGKLKKWNPEMVYCRVGGFLG